MSAAEIIEMIKKLPPEQRAEVAAYLRQAQSGGSETKVASDGEFERAAQRVFTENKDLLRRLAQ